MHFLIVVSLVLISASVQANCRSWRGNVDCTSAEGGQLTLKGVKFCGDIYLETNESIFMLRNQVPVYFEPQISYGCSDTSEKCFLIEFHNQPPINLYKDKARVDGVELTCNTNTLRY